MKTMSTNLALPDQSERLDYAQVSADFFDVFGITPQYGRLFIPQDEQAGHEPVVVVSNAFGPGVLLRSIARRKEQSLSTAETTR